MKISTTKIRQIIKEELRNALSEGHNDLPSGTGSTIYGPSAGGNLAGQRSDGQTAAQDPDKTQEIDMDPHLNSTDPWLAAETFRPESERLFNHFFGNYDDDAMELLLHEDPNLREIIRHLYGWDLNMFPKMREPNPPYVEVAQDFEKEGKHILDNEDEFLDRLEPAMDRWGKARFAAQMKHKRPAAGSAKIPKTAIPGTKEFDQLQDLFKVAKPRPPRS